MISAPRCSPDKWSGLIQHSIALRLPSARRPFEGLRTDEMVKERFSARGGDYSVEPLEAVNNAGAMKYKARHSPLVADSLTDRYTDVRARQAKFLERHKKGQYVEALPPAVSWAGTYNEEPLDCKGDEPQLVFAEREEDGEVSANDFLVKVDGEANLISELLLDVVAHRRSLLFGLALANRFVNVMLPHALLKPSGNLARNFHCGCRCCREKRMSCRCGCGYWLLQPLVSLIRVKHGDRAFRPIYTLNLFLIPVASDGEGQRQVATCEIDCMVNAGWSLASAPKHDRIPQFEVKESLCAYLSHLSRMALPIEGEPPKIGNSSWPGLTLRQVAETIAFALTLGLTQGVADNADDETRRAIGDDVVTSLGSARASSVVVVDPSLEKPDVYSSGGRVGMPPGGLRRLMSSIGGGARVPPSWSADESREYRLDRNFVNEFTYALGVLPVNRCLVVTSAPWAQRGRRGSALTRAASMSYMTIGAAAAIGTMRVIDRELEVMGNSDPRKIADIERQIAVDLHEIYDLDITQEGYRRQYRLVRETLGITRDYEALREKMRALDSEMTTRHELRSQELLTWLTAAIVALSLLLLVVAIFK
ncbi:MAG TPA: hypothetical protein VL972_05675 [Solirubrobacteraceae bacterium]|nr:hypothetical protein [Solirubrobacteraceae bacterium]